MLTLQFFGLAAGPLGWVRSLWELTPLDLPEYRPNAPLWEGFNASGFYVLSIGLSLAIVSELFAVSITAERREDASWYLRAAPFCAAATIVVAADSLLFTGRVGYVTGLLGLADFIPRAFVGASAFERKDMVLDGASGEAWGGPRRPSQALVVMVGLTLLLTIAVWIYMSRR